MNALGSAKPSSSAISPTRRSLSNRLCAASNRTSSARPEKVTPRHEADQRFAVSVNVAIKMLGMSQSRLYELLEAGLIGSYLDGKSRKILVHSHYMYQIRLLDQAIDVEAQRMDRLGIPGAEEWLTPKG